MESRTSPWLTCRTLEEAAELTAQWIEGSLNYHPAYVGNGPNAETSPLVATLAQINRCGFLTESSQPGEDIIAGAGQRAFVDGYCTEEVAGAIVEALTGSELVLVLIAPGEVGCASICVTVDNDEPFTFLGRTAGVEDIEQIFLSDTTSELVADLQSAWQLQIFDPVWGRKGLLWEKLTKALGQRVRY